jgi:hypothetical protein
VSPRLLEILEEFLPEMEALVEADDGTVFQCQHIDMLEEMSDLLEETRNG